MRHAPTAVRTPHTYQAKDVGRIEGRASRFARAILSPIPSLARSERTEEVAEEEEEEEEEEECQA